jgi:hypothetical protein
MVGRKHRQVRSLAQAAGISAQRVRIEPPRSEWSEAHTSESRLQTEQFFTVPQVDGFTQQPAQHEPLTAGTSPAGHAGGISRHVTTLLSHSAEPASLHVAASPIGGRSMAASAAPAPPPASSRVEVPALPPVAGPPSLPLSTPAVPPLPPVPGCPPWPLSTAPSPPASPPQPASSRTHRMERGFTEDDHTPFPPKCAVARGQSASPFTRRGACA